MAEKHWEDMDTERAELNEVREYLDMPESVDPGDVCVGAVHAIRALETCQRQLAAVDGLLKRWDTEGSAGCGVCDAELRAALNSVH